MALASKKKKERVENTENTENTENNEHESDDHHHLDRETRQVSDVDSEALILAASPNKVDRNQASTVPLLA